MNKFDWRNNRNPLDRLNALRTLEEDWDGYGSHIFTDEHIQKAIRIYHMSVKKVRKEPFVSASYEGCIYLTWEEVYKKLRILIPCDDRKNINILIRCEDGVSIEKDVDEVELFIMFDWFFGEKHD